MIKLLDGPAKGVYAVHRAPVRLRAVLGKQGFERDVLNELADTPSEHETIAVYERVTPSYPVHINTGHRKGTGFYVTGDYRFRPDVDGESVRATPAWRKWAAMDIAKELGPNTLVDMDTGEIA